MRPTLQEVLGWNTHAVSGAGECAEHGARELEGALDAAVSAARCPDWRGLTKSAALRRLAEENDHGTEVQNVLQQITDEAKDAGTDLTHAKAVIEREVHAALSAGFWLSPAGEVTHKESSKTSQAHAIQARIQRGLDVIDDIDEHYGARLADLRSDLASMIGGQPDVSFPGVGPLDADVAVARLQTMTASQRRAVLARMSATDIRRLVQADPEVIGNLEGVRFDIRATANEVNIRNALATELRTHGNGSERAKVLRSLLGQRNRPLSGRTPQGMPAHNDPDDHQTERTFVTFRPDSMHLVEMVGTLHPGSRNATVYVPGTGTNAASFGGSNWNSAYNLAQRTGGPVFVYLDGDLPQKVFSFSDGGANDTRPAVHMATNLVDFSHELRAEIASASPGAKISVLGHSYGGTVVGTAEQLGLDADTVIYASSAGTGAYYSATWDNANPHVERFSLTAPGDPIQAVQSLEIPHGGDPDTAPGVKRLDTGFFSDGTLVAGQRGHGGYFDDPDSTAFVNMVKAINGDNPDLYVWRAPDNPAAFTIVSGADEIGLPSIEPPTKDSPPVLRIPTPGGFNVNIPLTLPW